MNFLTSSQKYYFARKPHPKEEVCGDDGAAWDESNITWLVVSDGLGHGQGAANATEAALKWITEHHTVDVEATVRSCDRAIRHTRGVSLNLARIDRDSRQATYLSVGANLGWKVHATGIQRLVGSTGVVGSGITTIRTTNIDLRGDGFLVLASDGIGAYSDVSELYTSTHNGGRNLAESCLERWDTGTDDASILIYRFAL